MIYQANYTDENGQTHTATIDDEQSREAIRNDLEELGRVYDKKYVVIREVDPQPGEWLRLEVTVKAPSHYLTDSDDVSPKECGESTFTEVCYPGYPLTAMRAFYPSDHYLASLNVFTLGGCCINGWRPTVSNLLTVTEKLVRDAVHDPNVTRTDSVANPGLGEWYQKMMRKGAFPTFPPEKLFLPKEQTRPAPQPEAPARAVPPRRTQSAAAASNALPPRRTQNTSASAASARAVPPRRGEITKRTTEMNPLPPRRR